MTTMSQIELKSHRDSRADLGLDSWFSIPILSRFHKVTSLECFRKQNYKRIREIELLAKRLWSSGVRQIWV
jgi:hypothetical protein